ncbi:MAG: glucokinase [Gammaproteobacteria bacterium]
MRVLAGDIGGTNARLAIVEVEARSVRVARIQWFPSREAPDLAAIVKRFLADEEHAPEAACFGVAGRRVDGVWRTPNLPWNIDERGLTAALDIARISVINDFAAVGHGLALLGAQDIETLQQGEPVANGPVALIGAGTGLGESFLTWESGRYRIHASEGGHTGFAARDQVEWELRQALQDEFGHVSWERVVSGPGLIAIYRHLAAMGCAPENEAVRKEMSQDDPAAVITRHGTDGTDALCAAALERFTALLGSKAGDLALTVLAAGGVYVAGGIAPRVVAKLKSGPFLTLFRAKGRLSQFMTRFPVHVVMNPNVGLFGAAAVAAQPIEDER